MEFQERESGLVVPKDKVQVPHREYGPLEIQDDEPRELASKALLQLWDAMNLSNPPSGIVTRNNRNHETYYQLYQFVGQLLLGPDYPEKEVRT